MKKLLVILLISFSLGASAQTRKIQPDTCYSFVGRQLYMNIKSPVYDSALIRKWTWTRTPQQKRKDRIFTIVATTIFSGITVWYFSK